MKKIVFITALITTLLLTISCLREPAKNSEPLGEVEKISFKISDYPETTNMVIVYRKLSSEPESEYFFYNEIWVRNYEQDFISSFEYKDPFVNPGETYNYKVRYSGNTGKTQEDYIVMNNDTANFTPSTGLGEITVKKPYPTVSINEGNMLTFSDAINVLPKLPFSDFTEENISNSKELYSHDLSIGVSEYFSTYTQSFDTKEINITNHYVNFAAPNVQKCLTKIIPSYGISYILDQKVDYKITYRSKINIIEGKSFEY